MKKLLISLIVMLVLLSCTDAFKADLSSFGSEHRVSMISGGKVTHTWISTGKVSSISNSDGWQFMDKETGNLVRVGGNIIIEVIR